MKYALLAYMILFGLGILLAVAAVVVGRRIGEKNDESPLEHSFDAVTAVVLLTGMIFIWRDVHHPLLKSSWQFVAPLTGALALWASWRDRNAAIKKGEGQKDPKRIAFSDYGTLLLLAPAIALNVWFAFQ